MTQAIQCIRSARAIGAPRHHAPVTTLFPESSAVLVDSDLAFAGSVRGAAESRGILLVHATGVSEGLDVLGCSRFRSSPPSHIIFDLDPPDGRGERVLEAAERGFPRTTVIALSDRLDASRACALLGRCTYLPRVGLTSEALVGALDRSRARSIHDFSHTHGLSPRERTVLLSIIEGLSVADIASQLECRPSTIKTYLQRMYDKTGRGSQRELLGLVVDWLTCRPASTMGRGVAVRSGGRRGRSPRLGES